MSIKVKHEGNATAAAFASAEGGIGKRRQQDAASMSSIMQHAANAGGQQLRGASAPGASPGRSSAQTIHAPLTGAPTPPAPYGATRSGVGVGGGTGVGSSRTGSGSGGIRSGKSANDLMNDLVNRDFTAARTRRLNDEIQRARDDDTVVESSSYFGQHSKDATWDGSRWVRRWRPGEKEALVLDQVLGVKDRWSKETEGRAYGRQKETEGRAYGRQKETEDRVYDRQKEMQEQKTKDDIDKQNNASANRIGEYIAKLRADQATKPDVATPLEEQKMELLDEAIAAANRRKRQFGDVGTTDKGVGGSFDAAYDAANSNLDGIRTNYQAPNEVDGATNSEEGTNASKSDVGEESSSGTDASSGGEDVSMIDRIAGY